MEATGAFAMGNDNRKAAPLHLGHPHAHFSVLESTNLTARKFAEQGAPNGTIVTAEHQTTGRGRFGRSWFAPPGKALLLSVALREFDPLLALRAGVAVAATVGDQALVKWPNDVLVAGKKVAGVLVQVFHDADFAILGIGANIALEAQDFPLEISDSAGTLGLSPAAIEPFRKELISTLERSLLEPKATIIETINQRDALRGRHVETTEGTGVASGIDWDGRLLLTQADGSVVAVATGEVNSAT